MLKELYVCPIHSNDYLKRCQNFCEKAWDIMKKMWTKPTTVFYSFVNKTKHETTPLSTWAAENTESFSETIQTTKAY